MCVLLLLNLLELQLNKVQIIQTIEVQEIILEAIHQAVEANHQEVFPEEIN